MLEQVRVTYAQKKLLNLLQERKLKSWCEEKNVPHATLYKLATGNIVPSFIVMSSLVPYFAPAEWVYFTDEDIPYEVRTLEVWNPDDTSLFIKKHKYDYMEVEKKYEISETNARNIFVNRRANITLLQMRKMTKDVNQKSSSFQLMKLQMVLRLLVKKTVMLDWYKLCLPMLIAENVLLWLIR